MFCLWLNFYISIWEQVKIIKDILDGNVISEWTLSMSLELINIIY